MVGKERRDEGACGAYVDEVPPYQLRVPLYGAMLRSPIPSYVLCNCSEECEKEKEAAKD